ncbi:hypothetical protein D3C85_652600 [compost metagenome]
MQILNGHRADTDGQLVVGLKGRIVEGATGLDADAGLVGGRTGIDVLHRGGEILDVQANPQPLGQAGPGEAEDDLAVALLDIRADPSIRQVDDNVALTLLSTLEVHTTNGLARVVGAPGGLRDLGWACLASNGSRLPDHHEQGIAFDPRTVGRQLRQVDHQSCSILDLDHRGTAYVCTAQVTVLAGQVTGHPRQIEGNSRGFIHGVAMRFRGWPIESQFQLDAITR